MDHGSSSPDADLRLRVRDLRISSGEREIVHGIDFDIHAGEWFSVIGESGSGKSLSASAIMNLLPEGLTRAAGELRLGDEDLLAASERELRRMRGARVAYVFQNYASAFTPYFTIGYQMRETLAAHGLSDDGRVREALESVRLDAAFAKRYPFELSGGQLQRVALATAMLLDPELLIADEPTTALDAVTQHEVLKLIDALRHEHDCSVLFVTHDLRCVRSHADTVMVLKDGNEVESGAADSVLVHPQADYTRRLFNAMPRLDEPVDRLPEGGK